MSIARGLRNAISSLGEEHKSGNSSFTMNIPLQNGGLEKEEAEEGKERAERRRAGRREEREEEEREEEEGDERWETGRREEGREGKGTSGVRGKGSSLGIPPLPSSSLLSPPCLSRPAPLTRCYAPHGRVT